MVEGLYFINNRIELEERNRQRSIEIQIKSTRQYISTHSLHIITINPYQLHDYYTILHALLFDLQNKDLYCDFLLIHSQGVIEDFIFHYPEYWRKLSTRFNRLISVQ
ncbi:hypothetical protein [Peribacillus kribbensis]|uniref:hypothetical protein n=1 Tax=Peribacillus kribbensis TaxID=356658 RepID=UPI0003FCACF2|nr:hypothetical protein [Peribacillus kribbensis]